MFQDRWKLIDHDTLPRYLAYVRESPEQARKLVATPVSVRMAPYRLCAQAGRLAAVALTGWDLGAGATHAHPRAFAGQHAMIDLTSPPTRESAGYARNADSRIWINRHRRPFDVEVTLPGGRVYHTRAETAVMVSSVPTGNPDRLIVQLPPAASMPPNFCWPLSRPSGASPLQRPPPGAPMLSAASGATTTTARACSQPTMPALSTWSSRSPTTCATASPWSPPCSRGTRRPHEQPVPI